MTASGVAHATTLRCRARLTGCCRARGFGVRRNSGACARHFRYIFVAFRFHLFWGAVVPTAPRNCIGIRVNPHAESGVHAPRRQRRPGNRIPGHRIHTHLESSSGDPHRARRFLKHTRLSAFQLSPIVEPRRALSGRRTPPAHVGRSALPVVR